MLRALDGRAQVTEYPRALLRGLATFRALPALTLDALAVALRPVAVPDGGSYSAGATAASASA